jgi:hypothetical protein
MLVSCMSSREVFSIVADRCIYSIHKFRSKTICVYMYYAYCFHLCSCKSSFTFASRVVFSVAYCFLYMFQMKSNGESDENILYLLTSNIAEALIISPCAAAKVYVLQGLPQCWGFCRVMPLTLIPCKNTKQSQIGNLRMRMSQIKDLQTVVAGMTGAKGTTRVKTTSMRQ